MKKINLLLKSLFIVTLCLGFSSCETEPLEGEFGKLNPPNNTNSGSFSAEIDGVPYTATFAKAWSIPTLTTPPGEVVQINANDGRISNSMTFMIVVEDVNMVQLSSYPLSITGLGNNDFWATGAVTFTEDMQSFETPVTWATNETYGGTLTITEIDRTNEIIKGTFEFNAELEFEDDDSPKLISVTKGKFNIPYEQGQ
ncbi:DUF6252 family protein [Mesonia sp. HuA40]|uniref:DUF6252 family protein n=1 Tax=Mesonia sp. HuA40 TaxID=2602761 RepID=UPI0011C833F4|nr:DUF6252 family protein [Mesonia sp. HuA40]TXK71145.1 hypothetical protein FT993_11275 [Mesonia sp. HuA40]